MADVADLFSGELATELLLQLVTISAKSYRHKRIADNLITLIESIQPTIKEIQSSGVELPAHRQAQIDMLFETLEKSKKITEKVLCCHRWNMVRQLFLVKKMEKLKKTLSSFVKAPVLTNILADIHLQQANSDER